MTREEAIKRLEWLRMVGKHVDSVTLGKEDMEYFDMAISALREQDATDTNVGCKTNADHIRSMTDEELAKWMDAQYTSCSACSEYERCNGEVAFGAEPCDGECTQHYLEWLKKPYEEE